MKLCFVTLNAGPYLTDGSVDKSGGIELQQVTLGLKLRDLGYKVTFVTLDEGKPKNSFHKDIRIIRAYRDNTGIPVLRFFYPRLTSLWRALKEADADIYVQAGSGVITGVTGYFCKKNQKKFIFCVSNERDVDGSYIRGREFEANKGRLNRLRIKYRDGPMYRYGLKRANTVVSQNEYQREQLLRNHQLESVIIKTGQVIPPKKQWGKENKKIIWVANIREIKNPYLFLELAKEIPEGHFQMIGGPKSQKLYDDIKEKAVKIDNLDFVGHVPYQEISRYYEDAAILVNTSVSEGGPIIFQEAWMRNVPVVSLNVDPDECICQYRLGFHSKTFKNMISHTRLLLQDEKLQKEMGENGRRYVEENHDIDQVVKSYTALFNLDYLKD